ncbi:hypothetical protein LTR66_015937, partial [Elasticomyces elasticus]
ASRPRLQQRRTSAAGRPRRTASFSRSRAKSQNRATTGEGSAVSMAHLLADSQVAHSISTSKISSVFSLPEGAWLVEGARASLNQEAESV